MDTLQSIDFFGDGERVTEVFDTEESILSYLLVNPSKILEIKPFLPSSLFKIKDHRIIYESLCRMALDDLPIDAVQLEIYLDKRDELNLVGGAATINAIAGSAMIPLSESSFRSSVRYLVEKAKREKLLRDLRQLEEQLKDLANPYRKLSESAEAMLGEFLKEFDQRSEGLKPIASTIEKTLETVLNRTLSKRNGEQSIAIPTGFADLDTHTGGWRPGNFAVIAGRPGMGKSSFAGNLCLEIAKSSPVAFFSMEMTFDELNERYLSMKAQVNSGKIRDGELENADFDKLIAAAAELKHFHYWGCDNFTPSIDFIVSEARKLHAKHGRLGAIAVDYIQLLVQDEDKIQQEISGITRKLKQLAVELQCPIFGLSQLNRSLESRNDKRPTMSDLRQSGRIEEDADIVIMLYRDEVYNPESPDKGIAEVIFRKFRNGKEGVVKLVFDGETISFKNLLKKF